MHIIIYTKSLNATLLDNRLYFGYLVCQNNYIFFVFTHNPCMLVLIYSRGFLLYTLTLIGCYSYCFQQSAY